MAAKAQRAGLGLEKSGLVGGVHAMTTGTLTTGERRVLCRQFQLVGNSIVTG